MKKTICKLIHIFLLGAFVFCPALALAHGGGGGGGGGGDDAASEAFNSDSNSGDSYLMGGGVTWNPNPNDRDGMRGSIYDGRDANIEKGPFIPERAVEDAIGYLLAGGFTDKDGNYTKYTNEEVLDQLEWAESVGITLSAAAHDRLYPKKPSPTKSSLPQKEKDKEKKDQKNISAGLNFYQSLRALYKLKKATGGQVTEEEIALCFLAARLKEEGKDFGPIL